MELSLVDTVDVYRKRMENKIEIFTASDGKVQVEVQFGGETFWMNLNQIAMLFERDKSVISRHLKNIYKEGELLIDATVAKNATVQKESGRLVKRQCCYILL